MWRTSDNLALEENAGGVYNETLFDMVESAG